MKRKGEAGRISLGRHLDARVEPRPGQTLYAQISEGWDAVYYRIRDGRILFDEGTFCGEFLVEWKRTE